MPRHGKIVEETIRSLRINRPAPTPTAGPNPAAELRTAVRDFLITVDEPLDAVELADPDDRHVAAAAVPARRR